MRSAAARRTAPATNCQSCRSVAQQADALEVRDLDRLLQRLPPEHREVLLLVAVEELSYGQVASALGVPIGTVMSRLSRARAAARRDAGARRAGKQDSTREMTMDDHPLKRIGSDPAAPITEADLHAYVDRQLLPERAALVRPPSLVSLGYELSGGHLLPGDKGPVAQFMYGAAGGQRLTLYVTREVPGQANAAFKFGKDGPVNLFYWVEDHVGYAISAGADRAELMKVSQEVHRQLKSG